MGNCCQGSIQFENIEVKMEYNNEFYKTDDHLIDEEQQKKNDENQKENYQNNNGLSASISKGNSVSQKSSSQNNLSSQQNEVDKLGISFSKQIQTHKLILVGNISKSESNNGNSSSQVQEKRMIASN